MHTYRVAIVGAGPIGLELAVALKQLGVDYLHLDAGQIGQTISWYPRQVRFFSSPERIAIAGVPLHNTEQAKTSREQYLTYLLSVAEQYDLPVRTFERVERIERTGDGGGGGFALHTTRRGRAHVYRAEQVVLAIGDMHGPRELGVPGEELEHVSHYFDEPHRYFRQRLLIVGGRNSMAEAALRCHRAGARVSISYRQPWFDERSIKYWLMPELRSLIKHGQITFYPSTIVERIDPERVRLVPCPATPAATPATTPATSAAPPDWLVPVTEAADVDADFVLLLTGYQMDTSLFEQVGVELVGDNRAPRFDPATMQTNVPGLYVAGTAAAGTQKRFKLFIENCHPHVTRIVRAITGQDPPRGSVNPIAEQVTLPES
ncbi:MAG: NAD(P)-binding domain-containing protein [Phycisphaeraceae bacterium]